MSPAKEAAAPAAGAGAAPIPAAPSARGAAAAPTRAVAVVQGAQVQTTLATQEIVRHLMWHKAQLDLDEDGADVTRYIDMVAASADGEHVAMKDDFQRSVAVALELVLQHHLDPWNIDLSKFAQLYLKEARERGVDLVTAGRILLMAWTVLKLQSDEAAERATYVPPVEDVGWEDLPDLHFSDDQWDFTQRVQSLPVAPIDEKIRHHGDRKVTLMELLSAFQEVHDEAEQRVVLSQQKLQARLSLKRRMRGRLGNGMHKEDLQAEVAETWARVLDYPALPVPFSALHEADAQDLMQTFTGVLHLVRQGRLLVSQTEFPRGEIWVTPVIPEAATVVAEEVKA